MFHNANDDQSFFDYNNAELEDCLGSYLHDVGETEFRGTWARFQVDMGTCDEMAFDVLINALLGFSKDFFGLKKIYVGGRNKNWPVPEVDEEVEVRSSASRICYFSKLVIIYLNITAPIHIAFTPPLVRH